MSKQKKDVGVLICHVSNSSNDNLAKQGADEFVKIISGIGFADSSVNIKPFNIELGKAMSAAKLEAEFTRLTSTLVIIGHGSAVYQAVMDNGFFVFAKTIKNLQSIIFISCELDKNHFEIKGFEANVINLLAKSFGSTPKLYAAKTTVNFKVIKSGSFSWLHTPCTHIVPNKNTLLLLKNTKEQAVEESMDIFFE